MSENGKKLQDYRELYIQLAERSRTTAQHLGKLAQDCQQLRSQVQLATKFFKDLNNKTALPRLHWILLTALLGGLIGAALAAMIARLIGV